MRGLCLSGVARVWRRAHRPCVAGLMKKKCGCFSMCDGIAFAWSLGGLVREFGVVALDDVPRCDVLVDDALCELVVALGVWKTVSHELVAEGDELVVFEALG